ncbi:MAG: thiamine pyrophosphate-binding protein [Alphaproteobacteria bacterium]|nr:thiamine pyrophosphate-binding protein [Alphaproteobacteria bacterium]
MSAQTTSFLDWFAARLKTAGLERAFGVPGGGTSLDLMAGLRNQGIDTVITAREDAAMIMAGVSGVLAQAPGLAFSTKGPGLASASNGLASAALDRMPALLISETFGEEELQFLSHQVLDQNALVDPILEKAGAERLACDQAAVENWLRPPMTSPSVMFPAASDLHNPVPASSPVSGEPPLADLGLSLTAGLLSQSSNPVVVVGLEAAQTSIAPSLRALVNKLGAPVLCTYMAKGCVADDDPHYAGIFTGGTIEQACMKAADLIILVGLDPVELIRKPWAYDAPVLDLCEQAHDPHYLQPAARLEGPLAETLTKVAAIAAKSDWRISDIEKLKFGFLSGMAEGGEADLSSAAVVKATAKAFDGQPRLCVDAGAHMFSACAFWPAAAPRDVLISNGLATMGFALPAAIAAALHEPDRGAIAMTGDGGLMMCLGELKTAAQTGANITVLVFNDARLSLIDIKREDRQMPDMGLSWTPPDFAVIARGFGFDAWRVDTAAGFGDALQEAATGSGPRLIDIRIDASGYRDQMRALRG